MRLTKQVKISDDRTVEVRELTVGEIRQWFLDLATEAPSEADVVGEFIRAELSLRDLSRMTDLTIDDMDSLTQSALAKVIDCAKQINPDFFGLRERISQAGQRLAATAAKQTITEDN